MEQKEKNQELPEWVKLVGEFPGSIQESLGRSCAGCIASLVQIRLLSSNLYFEILAECDNQVMSIHGKEDSSL